MFEYVDWSDLDGEVVDVLSVVILVAQVPAVVSLDSFLTFMRPMLVLVLRRWSRKLLLREGSRVSEKSGAEIVLDLLFWREHLAQCRDLVAAGRPVVVVACVGVVGFGVDADVDSVVAAEAWKVEVVE